jgi:hypothetical protein
MTPNRAREQCTGKDSLIQLAYLTYERDAPALCREHTGEWVAYHGDRRVGLAPTRSEAWEECIRRGLPEGEFWVFDVQPIIAVEVGNLGLNTEYSEQ